MKKMNAPMMELVRFEVEDVIATSEMSLAQIMSVARPDATTAPFEINSSSWNTAGLYVVGTNGGNVYYYSYGPDGEELKHKAMSGSGAFVNGFDPEGVYATGWYQPVAHDGKNVWTYNNGN